MSTYRLRPLVSSDRDLLLQWRNSDRVRGVMYTDAFIKPKNHRAWFAGLARRNDICYRIFELDGRPVGLVNFINIDPDRRECSWGFYLGEENLPKGTGTRMCYLGLETAFEELGIRKVFGESFAFNAAALAVHRRLGFRFRKVLRSYSEKNGLLQDVARFEISLQTWRRRRAKLKELLFNPSPESDPLADDAGRAQGYAITVLSDEASWLNDYLPSLIEKLWARGHRVSWVHYAKDLPSGELAFFLSCGQIVPSEALRRHRHNLVVHESALPKGKGWSPLTWQVLDGKSRIPITLFEAVPSVDAGPIYGRDILKLRGTELVEDLRRIQAEKTLALCLKFVDGYPRSAERGRVQTGASSYYPRRKPRDSRLNPRRTLADQFNLLRVVDNERYPAYFEWKGRRYLLRISYDERAARDLA